MRVLVTGGAGFIGSHIVEHLIDEGHDVCVLDNLSTGRKEHLPKGIPFYQLDIASDSLDPAFARFKPDCVVHAAAHIDVSNSVSHPKQDARINIEGSINLLEACKKFDVRKVVYSSSAAVYGDPLELPVPESHPIQATSPYGVSKHVVEHYLYVYRQLYGIEYTALRYANVYGPRQDPLGEGGVVAIFTHRLARDEDVTIYGDGEQTRDYVYVGDVARANLLALTKGDGEIVNISCSTETSVNDLFELVRKATGSRGNAVRAPKRPGEIQRSVLANHRAQEVLGWTPQVPLDQGLLWVAGYPSMAKAR